MNHSASRLVAVVLLVASASLAGCAGWQYLGEREVGFGVDRDSIPVTYLNGRFRRIGLEVQGNAIEILELNVQFGNGEVVSVPVRQIIPAGGRTRAIDLPGAERVIRDVQLIYRTAGSPADGRARVVLYGLH